jgi:hypothetical protein
MQCLRILPLQIHVEVCFVKMDYIDKYFLKKDKVERNNEDSI